MARQYEPRGWLVKLSTGTLRKQWHRRYFVLSGNEIRYYKQEVPHPVAILASDTCPPQSNITFPLIE